MMHQKSGCLHSIISGLAVYPFAADEPPFADFESKTEANLLFQPLKRLVAS
jgi:hypothetical protein